MHVIAAVEMCSCQCEIATVEEELEKRNREVCQLQKNLQEAERIIVSWCSQGSVATQFERYDLGVGCI